MTSSPGRLRLSRSNELCSAAALRGDARATAASDRRVRFTSEMTHAVQQVYLMRHGETEWSLSGQHTSITDIPSRTMGERCQAVSRC
jgi:hypothetical protein